MQSLWLRKVATGLSLLGALGISSAHADSRLAVSPSYAGRDPCPARCSVSGPNFGNWSLYHNFEQFQHCQQTLFYQFALYDAVDDPASRHRIFVCSSYGPDWANMPNATENEHVFLAAPANASYEIGWEADGSSVASSDLRSLLSQAHQFLSSGYAVNSDSAAFLFGQSGNAAFGLRVGQGLHSAGVGSFALQMLQETVAGNDTFRTLSMQLCDPNNDKNHTFGFMAASNGTFTAIQEKLKSWHEGRCTKFSHSRRVAGPLYSKSPYSPRPANSTGIWPNMTMTLGENSHLQRRDECRTIQVQPSEGCPELAQRCGVSGAKFESYNTGRDFCSTLVPSQHVCCSPGSLPDYRPKPNPDGSCKTWPVHGGDTCASIAAENGITVEEIVVFNGYTWGWNGCGTNMWEGTLICLTKGTPPMPAPVANTVCGPQVPGTKPPTDGTDIAKLNPCPLNACCDVWGQCGTTAEFCTDTSTGPPGTAKPETNGCISNCGTNIVRSSPPDSFRKIGYFEGYNLGRKCLNMDAMLIDTSKYTHLHFAFGGITSDYSINMPDKLTEYEFYNFKRLTGVKRILSFGGWEFSTSPATYAIFRQGVTAANRLKLATNIANYVKLHGLDGVDIDWEYPSAPDLPDIPPGDKSEGYNYLAFLAILKNLLPGKSVSIAAPASYWYLKGFPIAQISRIVDYIVYMTYDLHGQWDSQNRWSQPGCSSGMCLRSGVNLTETINALVMITKAGVPSNKVVVGVTSYGRSFGMADANCHGPDCFYVGGPLDSHAKKGVCTDTAGYISDAEIKGILKNPSRVNHNYVDGPSNSNILVYDDTEWVSWMSPAVMAARTAIYKSLNMGGTTNWAIDLEDFVDLPPGNTGGWPGFVIKAKQGGDPWDYGERHGNWTVVPCSDRSVVDLRGLSPQSRWRMMDADTAWNDAIEVWKTYDRPGRRFTESLFDTFHGPKYARCGSLRPDNNCAGILECQDTVGSGTGPAGAEIANSLVLIHEMYASFYDAINTAGGTVITGQMAAFVKTFAPVPPPKDDTKWLNILLDVVGLGTTLVAGPFFNSVLSKMPYFLQNAEKAANLKDTTMALIAGSTSIAKNFLDGNKPSDWSEDKQDLFAAYMSQTVLVWSKSVEESLQKLFIGDDESIAALTSIISDGKLISGSSGDVPSINETASGLASDMTAHMAKAFYAYAIPAIWDAAGAYPFVVDSGYACGTIDPLGAYMTVDTMRATWACYEDRLYYLASLKGDAYKNVQNPLGPGTHRVKNKFSAPSGVTSMGGDLYGGVTLTELITGAVRTYKNNGNSNGAPIANPKSSSTASDLMTLDVTTPGFVRLPVCSPEMAFKAWDGPGGDARTKTPNYPCAALLLPNRCGDSTFEDQTSGASPKVSDCETLVKNLQNGDGKASHEVENAIGKQHQLDQFGSCRFGVQGKGKNGNIDFHVGGQDIIDLINDSIKKFARDGRVGAKGRMTCDGTVKGQSVEWGLY